MLVNLMLKCFNTIVIDLIVVAQWGVTGCVGRLRDSNLRQRACLLRFIYSEIDKLTYHTPQLRSTRMCHSVLITLFE